MRKFAVAVLLFAFQLAGTSCQTGPPPAARSSLTDPTMAREGKEVVVCISGGGVDILSAVLKTNKDRKDRVLWKSHDTTYVVEFENEDWGFHEPPDSTVQDGNSTSKWIFVPAGSNSRSFRLGYDLTGGRREHHYTIFRSAESDTSNGPAVVGEG